MPQELSLELIEYLGNRCCEDGFSFIIQENGRPILQETGDYIIKE